MVVRRPADSGGAAAGLPRPDAGGARRLRVPPASAGLTKERTMGLLDDLSDLAKQFTAGNAPAADVHKAYDQVSGAVPQSSLADGLTHAFNSDQTPPFAQMISNLFNQSSPDQKAGLLNQIVATLGPGVVSQIAAGAGGMSGLAGMLSGGSVTPAQAQQVSPEQ